MSGIGFTHESWDVFIRFGSERFCWHLNSRSKLISLSFHKFSRFSCCFWSGTSGHFTTNAGGFSVIKFFKFKHLSMFNPVDAFMHNRIIDRTKAAEQIHFWIYNDGFPGGVHCNIAFYICIIHFSISIYKIYLSEHWCVFAYTLRFDC